MDYERINAALREASDTRCVVIGAGRLAAVEETFAQCLGVFAYPLKKVH